MDRRKLEKYHFIGIGGIGMSALAHILLDKKCLVSGSDLCTNKQIQHLQQKGAVVQKGHSAKHISHYDTVVYSSSISPNNPEYQTALALKCPLLHRSELLAQLMQGHQTLAVTGTHGKTTASAFLTRILTEGGLDPSFAIGGVIDGLNGKEGKGEYFVLEADESDGTFLNYYPEVAIVTNVEPEHMDHFKTKEALYHAFETFFQQVKQVFYCGDDVVLKELAQGKGVSYGFSSHCQLQLFNYRQNGWHIFFDLHFDDKQYAEIELALPGEHNALNAAAVFGLALRLGVEEGAIRHVLKTFPSLARRCQKKGEVHKVLFLDDYAHHPTEIKETLKAVKKAVEERRLIVVYQPHRYTRTQDQLKGYGTAFEWADFVYMTDIYAASEKPIENITAETVVKSIQKHSTVPCEYLPRDQWVETISAKLCPHDVVLTMGAGDITGLNEVLQTAVSPKLVVGLVFGGQSSEHEISLRSSRFVADSLNRNLYEVRYFGVDKQGKWVVGNEAETLLKSRTEVISSNSCYILDRAVIEELEKCDLFLPIVHGPYCEDGTMQGFFEMLAKPYIGPDYRSAAITMDKVITKRLVASSGVPTPKDLTFGYVQWLDNRKALLREIRETFSFPVYVKPVHLGSSIGIHKVKEENSLSGAIEEAFHYDNQVMIEEGKEGCRELEFAVMGNVHGHRVHLPFPGEKLAEGGFVDYEKKYGAEPTPTTVHSDLEPELLKRGQQLAKKAYLAVGSSGMARVDFLLDPKGNYWFFEMNSIPGLQKLSLFPKIWKREGMSSERIFDHLIILALHRHRQEERHRKCLSS